MQHEQLQQQQWMSTRGRKRRQIRRPTYLADWIRVSVRGRRRRARISYYRLPRYIVTLRPLFFLRRRGRFGPATG